MAGTESLHRCELWYRGHVQGVGFRHRTRSLARQFDLPGFVKNLPDSRVYVVVEGSKESIDQFASDLSTHMEYFILEVKQHWRAASGEFRDFEIRY